MANYIYTDTGWQTATTAGVLESGAAAGGALAGTYPSPSLAASGVAAGTYGDSTHVGQFTVSAAGLITAATNVASGGGGTAGLVQLFDSTLGASAASIDTGAGGIAGGHDHLMVYALLQTDEAVTRSIVTWTFNNDTGANYDRQYNSASDASLLAGSQLAQTGMTIFAHGAGGTAQYPGLQQWTIPQYAGTTFYKLALLFAMVADAAAGQNQAEIDTFGYRSTSAISRMKVAAPAGKNLVAGSRLTIYGTR